MKVTDMTPGMVYAVPANRMSDRRGGRGGYGTGTAVQVRDGQIAVPFKIERVGKFRMRQSGACAQEVVDDYHTTTIVGFLPDLQAMLGDKRPENHYRRQHGRYGRATGFHVASGQWPGYPEGIPVKKMKWSPEPTIITPVDVVMPWTDFLNRRNEWIFVASEVAAYNARLIELKKQVYALVEPVLHYAPHVGKTSVNMSVPTGERLRYDNINITFSRSYDALVPFLDLPTDVRDAINPMLVEMAAIQRRLECAV